MKNAPGWYADPNDSTVERYFNGSMWQDQRRPRASVSSDSGLRLCPYCKSEIHADATRCPSCSGEMRFCPACQANVGLDSKQKFVGFVRGGTKTQYRCKQCARVLDGPRF
jgi:hypothetical protein